MKKLLITITIINFSLLISSAQVTQQWLKRYDFGGTSDKGKALAIDSDANIYVTGTGAALGNTDIITIKYDSAGQIIWTRVWNGPNNSYDGANAIMVKDNAVYITGFTEDPPLNNSNRRKDFVTLKYDLNGTLLWAAYYNHSATDNWEDIAYAIGVDNQDNVYVTGSSKTAVHQNGYRDIATIKYNANGVQQWVARYNHPDAGGAPGTNDDIPVALQVDGLGNVYLTGNSLDATTGTDYVTLKYDSSGVNLWERRYTMPGAFNDSPYAMKLDANANVYVTGASSAYAVNPALWYDYATIKYNTNGDTLWIRRFDSGATTIPWDEAKDLVVDDTGNVYVTGSVPSIIPNTYGKDFYTLKYDSSGTLIWESRWDDLGFDDHPNKMKLDATGNIYITGYSTNPNGTLNYATVKLNNSGQVQWFQTYQGPSATEHKAYDLVLDNAGGVYVTGQSYGFNDDYVTIKYAQDTMDAAPTPVTDAANVISMFSNSYVNIPVDTWLASWSAAVLEDIQIAGNDTKKYTALDFVGIEALGANLIDASTMLRFQIDVWTPNMTTFRIKLVDFGADGTFQGGDDSEHELTFTPLLGQWNSYNIPLSDFTNLSTRSHIAQLILTGTPAGSGVVYIDNIYFTNAALDVINFNASPIILYPNPTSSQITITSNAVIEGLEIYNVLGQKVRNMRTSSPTIVVNISDLPAGLYIVKLNSNDKSSMQRFIKE